MNSESRRQRIGWMRVAGLAALSLASLAQAVALLGVDRGWFGTGEPVGAALTVAWVLGLLAFGVLFSAMTVMARSMTSAERAALGDELNVFDTRRSAVRAFVVTYVVAVVLAVAGVAFDVRLPGATVALLIVAVATGTLAAGQVSVVRP